MLCLILISPREDASRTVILAPHWIDIALRQMRSPQEFLCTIYLKWQEKCLENPNIKDCMWSSKLWVQVCYHTHFRYSTKVKGPGSSWPPAPYRPAISANTSSLNHSNCLDWTCLRRKKTTEYLILKAKKLFGYSRTRKPTIVRFDCSHNRTADYSHTHRNGVNS